MITRLLKYGPLVFSLAVLPAAAVSSEPATLRTGDLSVEYRADELFSPERLADYADAVSPDTKISWEVHVPQGIDPENPPGVLTYIPPVTHGRIPDGWKPLMAEKNLIWIAANRSGNLQRTPPRVIYAVLGTELVRRHYPVNTDRLYLSGFSGGGRVASYTVTHYPELYRGAIYFCGVNYYDLDEDTLARMSPNRYVLMTGTDDFNLRDTRNVYKRYQQAGLPNLKYMNIPDMGHRLPSAHRLASALEYLDGDDKL